MALEFSKPVRLAKNRAHVEKPPPVPADTDVDHPAAAIRIGARAESMFRAGLARLFAADAQLRVVIPKEQGQDAIERALQLTPDAVLMDVWVPAVADPDPDNPNQAESPMFKVVVLAADFGHVAVDGLEENGGHQRQDVIPADVVSDSVPLQSTKTPTRSPRRPEVSKRELNVLSHVAAGMSNKQIGKLLGISQKTVRNHLSRIFHKLDANNRTEAVMNAMRLGLLTV